MRIRSQVSQNKSGTWERIPQWVGNNRGGHSYHDRLAGGPGVRGWTSPFQKEWGWICWHRCQDGEDQGWCQESLRKIETMVARQKWWWKNVGEIMKNQLWRVRTKMMKLVMLWPGTTQEEPLFLHHWSSSFLKYLILKIV